MKYGFLSDTISIVRSNIHFVIFIIFVIVIHDSCDIFFPRQWPWRYQTYTCLTHNQIIKRIIKKNFDEKRNKSKFNFQKRSNKNLGKFPFNYNHFLFTFNQSKLNFNCYRYYMGVYIECQMKCVFVLMLFSIWHS